MELDVLPVNSIGGPHLYRDISQDIILAPYERHIRGAIAHILAPSERRIRGAIARILALSERHI